MRNHRTNRGCQSLTWKCKTAYWSLLICVRIYLFGVDWLTTPISVSSSNVCKACSFYAWQLKVFAVPWGDGLVKFRSSFALHGTSAVPRNCSRLCRGLFRSYTEGYLHRDPAKHVLSTSSMIHVEPGLVAACRWPDKLELLIWLCPPPVSPWAHREADGKVEEG